MHVYTAALQNAVLVSTQNTRANGVDVRERYVSLGLQYTNTAVIFAMCTDIWWTLSASV